MYQINMARDIEGLRDRASSWIRSANFIDSAVLFGSAAGMRCSSAFPLNPFADIDIHIVACGTRELAETDWTQEMPHLEYCMKAWRPASGGVLKLTVVFSSGQMDLVVVPRKLMYLAKVAMTLGLHRRVGRFWTMVNEMATCLHGGYYFIKGEKSWGNLYRTVSQFPGVRLNDHEVEDRANAALVDVLWILQKLEMGEVVAAQYVLHSRVVDSTLRLWRELRLREALPLPSFGLGRRLEVLVDELQYRSLCVNSLASARELDKATREILFGMCAMVSKLLPYWTITPKMRELLERHGPNSRQP